MFTLSGKFSPYFLSAQNGAKPHKIEGKRVQKIFFKTFVDGTYVRCYNKLPSKNEAQLNKGCRVHNSFVLKGEQPDNAARTSRKRASDKQLRRIETTISMFRFAMTPKGDNDTSVLGTARWQTGYVVSG